VDIRLLDILFIYLFSYFLFKMKIYCHQYISILLIILTGIILDVILGNYNFSKILKIMIKLFCEIIFSFSIIINKYTMEKKFCPSYELCFYQGVILLFFILFF
jgi:hypothetical protein